MRETVTDPLLPPPGAKAGRARRVAIGLNWTLVEGPAGVGLAHSPAKGTQGCVPLADAGALAGQDLSALGAGLRDANPVRRALAAAAICAATNRRDLQGVAANGLDLIAARGGVPVIVGRFPALRERLPRSVVIEREPRPGEVDAARAGPILAGAETVAITASTFANGSLGALLEHCAPGAFIALIGPSTPLDPGLFAYGISALAGFVVDDADRAFRVVAEGGGAKALRACGRDLVLRPVP